MTLIEAAPYVEQLSLLRKFPRDSQPRKALIGMFAKLASDGEHAERIVAALIEEHSDWPGPASLREVATRTSIVGQIERSGALSQMERWRIEFERDVKPWLCQDCDGWGMLLIGHDPEQGKIGRYEACGCHEGQAHWMDPTTGKYCSPDMPGAVHYMSDEWLDRCNRNLTEGKTMPGYIARRVQRRQSGSERPSQETAA